MAIRTELLTDESASVLRRSFEAAAPFPHITIEDALDGESAANIAPFYPDPDWVGWHHYLDNYQQGKMICNDIGAIPAPLAALIEELTRPAFLAFLEKVTGIEQLLVDPYLNGGGLHCSGPGGVLIPHTDFHLYPKLGIYRRINVLLYLNEEWEEEWGGNLELFAPGVEEKKVVSVVPKWGTCVIFRTDDASRHGFTQPIADGHWRRSLALYYYTASEAAEFSGDTSTHWNSLPVKGNVARGRRLAYRMMILASRAIASFAHRIDPNRVRRNAVRTPGSS